MLTISLQFLFNGMTKSDWHDFEVFYFAAKAALQNNSIYIIVGKYNLPFWYPPWTAWFYIPLAILSYDTALIIYKSLFIICTIVSVNYLVQFYNPQLPLLDRILIFSLLIPMSLLVMHTGQMEYILLTLIIIAIRAINQENHWVAGLIFPFLWSKPHLLIIFTLCAFWRSGIKTITITSGAILAMLAIETVVDPVWYHEMFARLHEGQQRIDGLAFMTFPSLLGNQENWIGTNNLPFTAVLIFLAVLVVWKYRSLQTVPFLSLALTASLFCAPRAYAYDLPLLLPAMIWVTAEKFRSNIWVWLIASMIPLVTTYSTLSYSVVLLIFFLAIRKAHIELKSRFEINQI